MQAYPHSYRQGKAWLSHGYATFKKAPFTWASAMAAYTFLMVAALAFVPGIFKILISFSLGACFFVSFLIMAQQTHKERFFSLSLLFSGFTRQVKSLLLIGLIEGGLIFLSVQLWFLSDASIPQAFLLFQQKQDPAAFEEIITLSFFVLLTALALIKIIFIYAPPLAAFYEVPPFKSIIFSAVGVFRNVKPWLVFILMLTALIFASTFILMLIGSLAPNFVHFIPQVMLLYTICILYPIVYAGIYSSFMDVFKIDADLPTVV